MKKKKILILIILCIISFFSLSISFAFIIKETNSNIILTFGNIKMELFVTAMNDGEEIKISDNEKINITNNSTINRNIKISNIGNKSIFVRTSFDFLGTLTSNEEIDELSYIKIEQKDDNWMYKDGWFYYKIKLDSKETTEKLIVNFEFDINKLTVDYPDSEIILNIKAEAVQADNNNENVMDVVGWPSE